MMESFKTNLHLWICGIVAAALFCAFGVGSMHPAALSGDSTSASTTASAQQ